MLFHNKPALILTIVSLAAMASLNPVAGKAASNADLDANQLLIVNCLLPGKIMRLGKNANYMSARRPVKTTGADCEIRGGEYVAYDRANYATALKVWLPSAKEGDAKAQTYVGEMFEQGLGTTPDYATAVEWYRKAAEQGYDRAQMNLGSMYERGLGVPQDEVEALNWYRKATGLGADELVLASDVAALETEAEQLRTALAASEAEVASLKHNLKTSRSQMKDGQARLDQTRLELEQMRFRASQPQATPGVDTDALNQQIRQKETELANSRKELMDMRIAFDRQEAQFASQLNARQGDENAYQGLLDLEHEKIRGLEDQISQLQNSLQFRQSELRQSNEQLSALRRQLEAQAASDTSAANSSLAELSAIIASQKTELESQSKSIAGLENKLAQQTQALGTEKVALQSREKNLQQQAQSATAEQQAELQQERARIADLQSQVASLSRDLQLQQSSHEQNNSRLEMMNRQVEIANSQKAGSEESLAELSRIITTQQAELEQKSLGISYLEQELTNQKQKLTVEQESLKRQTQDLRKNADIAAVEQKQLEEKLKRTESQLAEYQQRLIENDRMVQQQQQEIQRRQDEISQLETDQKNKNLASVHVLETQLGDKSIELARAMGSNAALKAEKDALEAELQRLRQQPPVVALRSVDSNAQPATTRSVDVPKVDFGRYHALIIGNNDYAELPKLDTPINDAQALARLLETKYRFKTQVLLNADRSAILQALNYYREKLTDKDNFILYYAGHGTLDEKNDRGHWLPVDASPNSTTNWISNIDITDIINTMNAKHVMVIADSCYSGTLTRNATTTLTTGKSKKLVKEHYEKLVGRKSRTVLTSGGTQPVMDGGGGAHSIFANKLMQALDENYEVLNGPDLAQKVRLQVRQSASNEIGQEPEFAAIQNTGDTGVPFFFVPAG